MINMNENINGPIPSWEELKKKWRQYLCPPGNGVYTVHTGKERRSALQRILYNSDGPEKVMEAWLSSIDQLPNLPSRRPVILGICSDNGGGILRGANWGPLFIRQDLYGLNGQNHSKVFDVGDIRVIPQLLLDHHLHPHLLEKCRQALYQDPQSTLPVAPLSMAQDFARGFHQLFPERGLIGLGGDHSISYPLVSEYFKAKKRQNKRAALIHFDAHTDLLQERLGIDICFGSWVYHVIKDLPSPGHLVQIGIRSTGKEKKHWEETYGIKQFWARELHEQGSSLISERILEHLSSLKGGVDELYVTFDIDALDAQYAFATGTPETGGIAPHEAMIILQELCEEYPLTGADLTEVAPFTIPGRPPIPSPEPETTLLAASTISSFFIETMNSNPGGAK